MSDSYTEVSSEGWLSRIGDSIKGVLAGIVAVVISFPLLFWNEGRAVKVFKGLAEGEGAVVSVPADKVDAGNDRKLVHLSGQATTTDVVKDPEIGVAAPGLRLKRTVEMYQWDEDKKTEKKKKLGGGEDRVTTYTYDLKWDDEWHDSKEFTKREGHENPPMPLSSASWNAANVTLGAFKLSDSLVNNISKGEPLTIDPKEVATPAALTGKAVQSWQGGLYYGADASKPALGDLRVSYQVVRPQAVSVLSMQVGQTFEPFRTSVGTTIERLDLGTLTAAQMFEAEKSEQAMLTWIIRGVGWLVMFVGFLLIFKPLSVVADVVPFIGDLVGLGFGLVAFGLSLVGSLITIGVAWVFYRPLLGVPLLLGGIALIVMMFMKGKAARAAKAGAAG